MALFKRNSDKVATDSGDFRPIRESGIYDCTIERATLNTSVNGSKSIVLSVKTSEGEEATIYDGLTITQNNGQEHFQAALVNSLLTILDIDELDDPIEETITFGNKKVDLLVIPELENAEVKIKIVKRWYRNPKTNKIGNSLVIKRFYSITDGATGSEITNQVAELKQLKIDQEYASEDIYDKINKSDVVNMTETPTTSNTSSNDKVVKARPNLFQK